MTLLEIFLILFGVGIILISCFLVDRSSVRETVISSNGSILGQEFLTAADEAQIKEQIDTMIRDAVQETVWKTEDELSKLSNEKIIAVDDFSKQIIEKISQNHEEVVFLYNMLNEKDSDIKNTVRKLENVSEKLKAKTITTKAKKENVVTEISPIKPKTELDQSNQIVNHSPEEMSENNNDKILELYKQGNSIVEISKNLEIGQGEVKLVLDLFQDQ